MGLTTCNDLIDEAMATDAANEARYQRLMEERPEGSRRRDAALR